MNVDFARCCKSFLQRVTAFCSLLVTVVVLGVARLLRSSICVARRHRDLPYRKGVPMGAYP